MASSAAAAAGKFGKLWGRGHESFSPSLRRILSVKGKGATTYLQGLVTCDLLSEPTPPREEYIEEDNESSDDVPKVEFSSRMRSACFLDQRGRIVTDALLWKLQKDHQDDNGNDNDEEEYLIDVPGNAADDLLSHLNQYKLRRTKVSIKDKSDNISAHVVYGTLNAQGSPPGYLAAIDPRHPSLGMRILSMPEDKTTTPEQRKADFEKLMSSMFPSSNGTYEAIRKLAGVAEGVDVKGKTALECNQEFLNAISFQKGCYLGQELTARTHFTGVIRKRIMPIILTDTQTEVPQPWIMASKMQEQNREKVKDLLPKEVEDSLPAKLPNLSAPMVGGLISLVTGTVQMPLPSEEKNNKGDETLEDNAVDSDELAAKAQSDELKILQDAGEALFEEIFSAAKKGSKLIDTSDGKTIGQILAAPVPGLPVVLAQMRLDRVGLLESKKGGWSRMNRIRIGESKKEFRYLPYTPNWWPALDEKTGKELKIDESSSNPQE